LRYRASAFLREERSERYNKQICCAFQNMFYFYINLIYLLIRRWVTAGFRDLGSSLEPGIIETCLSYNVSDHRTTRPAPLSLRANKDLAPQKDDLSRAAFWRYSGDRRNPPNLGAIWARELTKTRTRQVDFVYDVSVVRRAASRFCAACVGAAPACTWIINGARATFFSVW